MLKQYSQRLSGPRGIDSMLQSLIHILSCLPYTTSSSILSSAIRFRLLWNGTFDVALQQGSCDLFEIWTHVWNSTMCEAACLAHWRESHKGYRIVLQQGRDCKANGIVKAKDLPLLSSGTVVEKTEWRIACESSARLHIQSFAERRAVQTRKKRAESSCGQDSPISPQDSGLPDLSTIYRRAKPRLLAPIALTIPMYAMFWTLQARKRLVLQLAVQLQS